jgi:hypothetical protein
VSDHRQWRQASGHTSVDGRAVDKTEGGRRGPRMAGWLGFTSHHIRGLAGAEGEEEASTIGVAGEPSPGVPAKEC